MQDDLCPIAAAGLHLRWNGRDGHHDDDVDPSLATRPGEALRGVARGEGDDAPLALAW